MHFPSSSGYAGALLDPTCKLPCLFMHRMGVCRLARQAPVLAGTQRRTENCSREVKMKQAMEHWVMGWDGREEMRMEQAMERQGMQWIGREVGMEQAMEHGGMGWDAEGTLHSMPPLVARSNAKTRTQAMALPTCLGAARQARPLVCPQVQNLQQAHQLWCPQGQRLWYTQHTHRTQGGRLASQEGVPWRLALTCRWDVV